MIASCYKQQFNVSVIMLIMMNDNPLIYFSFYKFITIRLGVNIPGTKLDKINLYWNLILVFIQLSIIFQIFIFQVDSIFLAKKAHPVHWGHISLFNADIACMEQLLDRQCINIHVEQI